MEARDYLKEIIIILIAGIIFGLSFAFPDNSLILYSTISFIIIILLNVITKKIIAYNLEADVKTKFWAWHQYGFRKDSHFKKPLPMLWIPLLLSFLTKGLFLWLGILETEITPRTERVSKRHGLYRFSEMSEWHIAWIAVFGIITNLILAIISYVFGFEMFSKLNIYFAFWSLIPLGSLDGNKILFGSKSLWFIMFVISLLFLLWSFVIV